jgi:hypothetical protein
MVKYDKDLVGTAAHVHVCTLLPIHIQLIVLCGESLSVKTCRIISGIQILCFIGWLRMRNCTQI